VVDDIVKCYKYLHKAIGLNLPDWVLIMTISIIFLTLLAMFFVTAYGVLAPPIKKIIRKTKPDLNLGIKDKELCTRFLSDLPSDGDVVQFLKRQDVRVYFRDSIVDKIDCFCNTWHDADHEFINGNLNKIKNWFLITLDAYRKELFSQLDDDDNGHGMVRFETDDMEQDLNKIEFAETFNEKGTQLYNIHQDLTHAICIALNTDKG
jgi:hypothetical protein